MFEVYLRALKALEKSKAFFAFKYFLTLIGLYANPKFYLYSFLDAAEFNFLMIKQNKEFYACTR